MLTILSCQCGSSDTLARSTLQRYGYQDYLTIPIHKGKDKSLSAISALPQFPELNTLRSYIQNASRFVVVVGTSQDKCRWADIATSNPKEYIEVELIVKHFA